MVEEYNEYGEIKPQSSRLSTYDEHRIHQTKDMFDMECIYCQQAAKKNVKSYWDDDE